jgi:hypothetical protein
MPRTMGCLRQVFDIEAQTYPLISQDFTASVVLAPSLSGIPVINVLLEVRTQPLVYLPMYSCPSDWYKFILVREQFTIPC